LRRELEVDLVLAGPVLEVEDVGVVDDDEEVSTSSKFMSSAR